MRSTNILSNFLNLSGIQVSNILLLVITIRIVTGRYGTEGFGWVIFSYRVAMLAGAISTYGTTRSGVRDIAYHINEPGKISIIISNALGIRFAMFILCCCALLAYYPLRPEHYDFLWFAVPVTLAEVFNPLCFFIGVEKVKIFNIYNLISNFFAVAVIFFLAKGEGNAVWVNFTLGTANVISYTGLWIYLDRRFKLHLHLPSTNDLLTIAKANFPLTLNDISANLQQSVIIFALEFFHPEILGAYGLADRVIGQCRNAFNLISNSIYPKAVAIYKLSEEQWALFRKKMKRLFSLLAFGGAVAIFIMADVIVFLLNKKQDPETALILRIMAFVLLITAFNVFSVLDLLLKQQRRNLFNISVVLICVSVSVAYLSAWMGNIYLISAFTIIIEGTAWLMYEYFIKKSKMQHA